MGSCVVVLDLVLQKRFEFREVHLDLNAATVHDNGVSDQLQGNGGLDWYFASLSGMKKDATDLHSGEVAVNIS